MRIPEEVTDSMTREGRFSVQKEDVILLSMILHLFLQTFLWLLPARRFSNSSLVRPLTLQRLHTCGPSLTCLTFARCFLPLKWDFLVSEELRNTLQIRHLYLSAFRRSAYFFLDSRRTDISHAVLNTRSWSDSCSRCGRRERTLAVGIDETAAKGAETKTVAAVEEEGTTTTEATTEICAVQ